MEFGRVGDVTKYFVTSIKIHTNHQRCIILDFIRSFTYAHDEINKLE